ncbi:MAG: superoxide dismutase family protein [Bdellovibrionales bacterium]|nr:superoxide dismutase family protein [Bdellovibrionales bacterium]
MIRFTPFIALPFAFFMNAEEPNQKLMSPKPNYILKAKAEMKKKNNSNVTGTIEFFESTEGLAVNYDLKGLPKNSKSGMHIHEHGDCSSNDAKSAGGHYLKMEKTHGKGTSKDNPDKYMGDLPEITADARGNAKGSIIVNHLSLSKENPVMNKAVIVHGGPDNITEKSAPRVACGVITGEEKI